MKPLIKPEPNQARDFLCGGPRASRVLTDFGCTGSKPVAATLFFSTPETITLPIATAEAYPFDFAWDGTE